MLSLEPLDADPTHLIASLLCAGLAIIAWLMMRSRPGDAVGNCCGDPNCLRCFPRTEVLESNATALRRLVRLEPDLFKDMRDEIWSAVEDTISKRPMIERRRTKREEAGSETAPPLVAPQEGQDPTVFLLPGLEAVPWHDVETCRRGSVCSIRLWEALPAPRDGPPVRTGGDIEALREGVGVMAKELREYLARGSGRFTPFDPAVYERVASVDQSESAEWSSIYLFHQGVKQPVCAEHFPLTTDLLESRCSHLMAGRCGFGSVYFSRLVPNTKVTEHCGPTNVRLRCHIPIIVPGGDSTGSYLSVGLPGVSERRVGWEIGTPLLFDDSFLHSAALAPSTGPSGVDDDDGARVVLIVDFWHPSLSRGDRNALGVLYPPGS